MMATLATLLQALLDWLGAATWRPLLATILGGAAVVVAGFLLARRVRRSARAALGTAWMVGALVVAIAFLAGCLVDVAATGHPSVPVGQGFLEWKLLGWFPGASWALPLSARPLVGLVVYQVLLTPLFLGIVALIGWSLQSGAHLADPDKAQTAQWLYSMTGRSPSGALEPGFVRWFGPLARALMVVMFVALAQMLLDSYAPHPAAWVTAQLFLSGCLVNLRAGSPELAVPAAEPETATEPPPTAHSGARPSLDATLAQLGDQGFIAHPASGGALVARAARYDASSIADAHVGVRERCAMLPSPHSPYAYQGELLRRVRRGESTVVCGPAGSGRSTALQLACLDAALGRWESALVVVSSTERAFAFAEALREALARGPTPHLVRIAAGHAQLIGELHESHEPVLFITTPEELRADITASMTPRDGFVRGLYAVFVDDLGQLPEESLTALRLALEELRLQVEERRGAEARFSVQVTSRPWGGDVERWASEVVGTELGTLAVDGVPRPRTDVVLVAPEQADAAGGGVAKVCEGLVRAGYAVVVDDDVHVARQGRLSLSPYPGWASGVLAAGGGGAAVATVVATRRADLQFAMERRRPCGPAGAGGEALLVLYLVDGELLPSSVHLASLAASADGAAVAEKRLRRLPPGARQSRVVRRHLFETSAGDSHDVDWLERVFGEEEVAALRALARREGWAEVGQRVVVRGEPTSELTVVPTFKLHAAVESARAQGWFAAEAVEVVGEPDGRVLGRVSPGLLHPRAAVVASGRAWRLSGRALTDGTQARAALEGKVVVVRRLRRSAVVAVGEPRQPARRVSYSVGAAPLVVDTCVVRVTEEVAGFEELSPAGELRTAQRFEVPMSAQMETVALRVRLPAAGVEPAALVAIEIAARVALCAVVALSEDATEVVVEATSGGGVCLWMAERSGSGGARSDWLLENVVTGPWFWQVMQEILSRGPRPAWRVMRSDELDVEPDAVGAHAIIHVATGFSGVGESEPGVTEVPAAAETPDGAGALVAGTACKACAGSIGHERAFRFPRVGPAGPDDIATICVRCHDTAERCDACGIPTERGLHRFTDGRVSCPECVSTAVESMEEMDAVVREGLGAAHAIVGAGVETAWKVVLGDAHAIAAVRGATFLPTRAADDRALGICVGTSGNFTLHIESGLPRVMALDTFIHEYAHAWQSERNPALDDEELVEGFAMWLSWRSLASLGHHGEANRLLARTDIYGVGLRRLRDIEALGGVSSVLAAVGIRPSGHASQSGD
jgi:hypothetical protein